MKVRIPLVEHWAGGQPCPYPLLTLLVRDRFGGLTPLTFRIDTGADLTTIPTVVAQEHGIPFGRGIVGEAIGLVGRTKKYRDKIRVLIAGREHAWPCDFVEVPASAIRLPGDAPPSVLGRAGFLGEYALALDTDFLVVTRLGPVRRVVRRCLHALWSSFGQTLDFDEPL